MLWWPGGNGEKKGKVVGRSRDREGVTGEGGRKGGGERNEMEK
jgi:hypothetical protein